MYTQLHTSVLEKMIVVQYNKSRCIADSGYRQIPVALKTTTGNSKDTLFIEAVVCALLFGRKKQHYSLIQHTKTL
jgi:hypothetical protein